MCAEVHGVGASQARPLPGGSQGAPSVYSYFDPKLGQPAQLSPCRHADGELAGYVARWDKLDGGKAINLPELRERSDDPVLVVKGEKTSDAVRDLLPSSSPITSMGEALLLSGWRLLKGREVVVWPDNDPEEEGSELEPGHARVSG